MLNEGRVALVPSIKDVLVTLGLTLGIGLGEAVEEVVGQLVRVGIDFHHGQPRCFSAESLQGCWVELLSFRGFESSTCHMKLFSPLN